MLWAIRNLLVGALALLMFGVFVVVVEHVLEFFGFPPEVIVMMLMFGFVAFFLGTVITERDAFL